MFRLVCVSRWKKKVVTFRALFLVEILGKKDESFFNNLNFDFLNQYHEILFVLSLMKKYDDNSIYYDSFFF